MTFKSDTERAHNVQIEGIAYLRASCERANDLFDAPHVGKQPEPPADGAQTFDLILSDVRPIRAAARACRVAIHIAADPAHQVREDGPSMLIPIIILALGWSRFRASERLRF